MRPHLRLCEFAGIALRALGQLAQITMILLLRGLREAAERERFVEQTQRIVEINARRRGTRGLFGGFVFRHSPASLATWAQSLHADHTSDSTHVTCASHRRASGLVQLIARVRVPPSGIASRALRQ